MSKCMRMCMCMCICRSASSSTSSGASLPASSSRSRRWAQCRATLPSARACTSSTVRSETPQPDRRDILGTRSSGGTGSCCAGARCCVAHHVCLSGICCQWHASWRVACGLWRLAGRRSCWRPHGASVIGGPSGWHLHRVHAFCRDMCILHTQYGTLLLLILLLLPRDGSGWTPGVPDPGPSPDSPCAVRVRGAGARGATIACL